MKHLQDQDLLLLNHRSLGPISSIGAKWHLSRCESCRSRYSQFATLSTAAASLFRVGMPAWKPLGMALRTKLLLSLVLLVGVFGVEMAVLPRAPRPVNPPSTTVSQPLIAPQTPNCPTDKPGTKHEAASTATIQLNLNAKPPTRRQR